MDLPPIRPVSFLVGLNPMRAARKLPPTARAFRDLIRAPQEGHGMHEQSLRKRRFRFAVPVAATLRRKKKYQQTGEDEDRGQNLDLEL